MSIDLFPNPLDTKSRLTELASITTQIRKLQAQTLEIIAELDQDHAAVQEGYSGLAALLSDLLRITPRRTSRMIGQARQVTETVTPTGYVMPAVLPAAREALREGVLDSDQLDVIVETVKKIPTHAPVAVHAVVESHLVDTARIADTRLMRQHAHALLARIDQDGPAPRDQEALAQPRNIFRYQRTLDGRMTFTGDIEPETAEQLDALLGTLARPDTATDNRTKPQRDGDAFTEIINHAIDNPDLPTRGGEKPHINVTLDLNALQNSTGVAMAESGALLTPSAVRRLACQANVIPIVLDGQSVPLDLGRKRRVVTTAQRTALIARHHGCTFPSCTMPARWTDAHHIKSWLDGGTTDLHNLVLLCRRHHRLIHHSNWEVQLHNGVPEFTPPTWIDPHQEPLRNPSADLSIARTVLPMNIADQ